jgi:hypothetical protein
MARCRPEPSRYAHRALPRGLFERGVACCVQILDKEDPPGQKLIDDGVSTVEALKICAKEHEKNDEATPSGEVWPECLVSVFRTGLHVRVVAYSNDDRESRAAWNTAKHDEERNGVRWSTLYQKVATAYLSMMLSESRDWKHVATRLLDLYSLGERCIVDRWIRVAKGMHPKVQDELKQYPDLTGAYLWGNPYLIQSPTHARLVLSPYYAVNALRILAEKCSMPFVSANILKALIA